MSSSVATRRSQTNQWRTALLMTTIMVPIGNQIHLAIVTDVKLLSMDENAEGPWYVLPISYVIGAVYGAIVCNKIGRKAALYGTSVSGLCGIVNFIPSIAACYTSLVIEGIRTGITCVAVSTYLSEIADEEIRGELLMIPIFGIFIVNLVYASIEHLMEAYVVYAIPIVLPIIFVIAVYWLPETPYYLARKKKYQMAEKSLTFFRGINEVTAREELENIIIDLENNDNHQEGWNVIHDLFTGKNVKALIVLVFLGMLRSCFTYVRIFDDFEYHLHDILSISPRGENIVLSWLKLMWIMYLARTIDVIGRKKYLLISTFLWSLAMSVQSILLPYHSYVGFITAFSMRLCGVVVFSVCFVLSGELFSTNVKGVAIAFLVMFNFVWDCIGNTIVLIYVDFCQYYMQYVFIAMCFVNFVILLVFLPETKKMPFTKIPSTSTDSKLIEVCT